MIILFVCTSNKDRSPALEKYFQENYPYHKFLSAGVNKYFCQKKGTTYLSDELISKADYIVFAEDVHLKIALRDFDFTNAKPEAMWYTLNLGEYEQWNINADYLESAHKILNFL